MEAEPRYKSDVRFLRGGAVGIALTLCSGLALAAKPWPARAPTRDPKPAHQLRSCATWPAEPNVPETIDGEKFCAAFAHLCSVSEDGPVAALAPSVLAAARAEAVDPFLLAALAFTGSGCHPKHKTRAGVGLLAID